MRILLYGGSFDPPHAGHVRAVMAAAKALEPGRIFLIPASLPPHKTLAEDSPGAQARFHMAELAAGEIPGAAVLDMELHRPGKSYTADTLRALKARYPNDELVFLMGTDMLLSLPTWHEPEAILALASIAWFPREAAPRRAAGAAALRSRYGATVYEIPGEPLEVSSTELRALLKAGQGSGLIPPAVYAYIIKHRFYGAQPELNWLREQAYAYLAPKRVAHVQGAEREAVALAGRWGASETEAAVAAICHDITKKLSEEEQLRLCRKYAIITDACENENEKLLHAKTGAALAGDLFGLPEAVCSAIRFHTTGRPDMTLLEKIIYLADYIEPGRTGFAGLAELRCAAYEDIDAAMELGMRMSMDEVRQKGVVPHENTVKGQRWFLERLKQRGAGPVHAAGIPDTI